MKSQPLVSLVVLNWNNENTIIQCIESLKKLRYPNTEILVVDNGSTDGSLQLLKKQACITLIELGRNYGFTGGHRAALPHSKGAYVAPINSDAIVDQDWLSELMLALESHTEAAAAGGAALPWEGRAAQGSRIYTYQFVNPYTAYTDSAPDHPKTVVEVGSLSGAAVVFRRSALDHVGYFDDIFFAYYEESDLFARFIRNGMSVLYVPSATIRHAISASVGQSSFTYHYFMHRNRFIFAARNFDAPYWRRFLWHYLFRELLVSPLRLAFQPRSTERRAKLAAFWWNVRHIGTILRDRERITSTGTYNQQLLRLQKTINQRMGVIEHG